MDGWGGCGSPTRSAPDVGRLDRRRVKPSPPADENQDVENHPEDMPMTITRRLAESQFVRFCAVGASGYVVNLAAYAALLAAGLHYLAAAAIAFVVAAGSNYVWNRTWTFQTSDAPVLRQGARALVVSALSLGANQLFLFVLVDAGAGHLAGQAVAIVLATPFSFAANKLWAFADAEHPPESRPVPVTVRSRDR
jgi:putative flippase GtrA